MKYILILALLTLTSTAFSQQKTADIPWIKSWGETASATAKLIQKNSEHQLELNAEIQQLKKDYQTQTDQRKLLTLKLIENKLNLIDHLIKENILRAQEVEQIIQIQKKGLPETK